MSEDLTKYKREAYTAFSIFILCHTERSRSATKNLILGFSDSEEVAISQILPLNLSRQK